MKSGRRNVRSLSGGLHKQMDRNTALQWVCSAAAGWPRDEPSRRSAASVKPTRRLSRGGALRFVVLLSLGLWALIWAALSLLAAYGLR